MSSLRFTYVDKSLFWEERKFPKDKNFFETFPDLAENVLNFSEVFSALLSKLHLAYPEDHSDTFFEFCLAFEPFRDVSSKCGEIQLKNFSTVFSKLLSSCTDEHVEQKLVLDFFKLSVTFGFWAKKIRAFDGELSARLSTLPSTYVDSSLFWEERKFPKDKNFYETFPDLDQKTFWVLAKFFLHCCQNCFLLIQRTILILFLNSF